MEQDSLPLNQLETRDTGAEFDGRTVTGLALPFHDAAEYTPGKYEIVEPGADRVVQVIEHEAAEPEYLRDLIDRYNALEGSLDAECRELLRDWPAAVRRYRADRYRFQVRERVVRISRSAR